MRLARLRLAGFRNYAQAELQPGGGLNLIAGANAQGKTNLLEAIWVLSGARSLRAADQGQLVLFGRAAASVEAALHMDASGSQRDLRLVLHRSGRRAFFVNGKAVRRFADVVGSLAVLWFSPDEVDVVRGAPAQRRRFLDVTLAQVDAVYRDALLRYTRIVSQRNHLLRGARDRAAGESAPVLLDAWDQQLAEVGGELTERRQELVRELERRAARTQDEMTGGGEALKLRYRSTANGPGAGGGEPGGPGEAAERLLARLRALRPAELARGATLAGPHRDDLEIRLGDTDLRYFGSRGQQRTAAVSLFVAAWGWMRQRIGEPPVLLLDDVASELDEDRRRRLFAVLPREAQIFLTGTDAEALAAAARGHGEVRVWRVSAGRLEVVPGS